MRDIEGIQKAVAKLRPHRAAIEQHFERENRVFIDLISSDHNILGRVLKCHLVVEHFLNRFLIAHFNIDNFQDIRLTFAQKANLLPNQGAAAAFVKPGILQLNKIRNRFSHSLRTELSSEDLDSMRAILDIGSPEVEFESPVDAIEAFTKVACAFLIVAPAELQQVLTDAFSSIRVRVDVSE